MKAYIFPGQGSQKKGMGKELFESYKAITTTASIILGYDIVELCTADPDDLLNKTQYTQPALYVVNALTYLSKVEQSGKPDYLAGHSLGEYNALFAAEVFDFATGLKLVMKRADLMGKVRYSAMAAVIGLKIDAIEKLLQEHGFSEIDIANYNSADQIVISGLKEDIMNAKKIFETNGARLYVPLNVSGAFHSRYMQDAKNEFKDFIAGFQFAPLKFPVISNVLARPYTDDQIMQLLSEQITSPVRWYESISYMIHTGVEQFEEVGPGNVLTKMIKSIKANPATKIIIAETTAAAIAAKMVNDSASINLSSDEKVREYKEQRNIDEVTPAPSIANISLIAEQLGNQAFKEEYNVKYAYVAGSMHMGIASKELVVRMAKASLLSFFGTAKLELSAIAEAILYIKGQLTHEQPFGMNLFHDPYNPQREDELVSLFIKHGIYNIEASAYIGLTKAIVYYRLSGLHQDNKGKVVAKNRIIAKLSRPEVALVFLSPAPEGIVKELLTEGKITREQADFSRFMPMADDICTEADSGSHTDQGTPYALLPTIKRMCDEAMKKYQYNKAIRVGAAGGIGTPEAAAAAFLLGADFILTGSINQCTVEASTSDIVKDMLQDMNIQDTDYAPSGDMFEFGVKVQVLKKGLFFSVRANKLYDLYKHYSSLEEIRQKDRIQLEDKYFKKSFTEVFAEISKRSDPSEVIKAESNPKQKMAMVFKWYFDYSAKLALNGIANGKVDYQIHCGPALGAFNQLVKGTHMQDWRNRHVDEIASLIMVGASTYLSSFYNEMSAKAARAFATL